MAKALVSVRFDVEPLVQQLERMGANAYTLPMDAFAQLVLNDIEEMFETQGAAGTDGEWDPLTAATLKRHPRRIGGMLLQDTGATANMQIRDVHEMGFTYFSPTSYSKFHITGTEHMVKRDFFALNFSDLFDRMGELALEEIRKT